MEVVIRKDGELWSAYDDTHKVASAKCKPCIINLMRKLTKNSKKYHQITVIDERQTVYKTGDPSADAHQDP